MVSSASAGVAEDTSGWAASGGERPAPAQVAQNFWIGGALIGRIAFAFLARQQQERQRIAGLILLERFHALAEIGARIEKARRLRAAASRSADAVKLFGRRRFVPKFAAAAAPPRPSPDEHQHEDQLYQKHPPRAARHRADFECSPCSAISSRARNREHARGNNSTRQQAAPKRKEGGAQFRADPALDSQPPNAKRGRNGDGQQRHHRFRAAQHGVGARAQGRRRGGARRRHKFPAGQDLLGPSRLERRPVEKSAIWPARKPPSGGETSSSRICTSLPRASPIRPLHRPRANCGRHGSTPPPRRARPQLLLDLQREMRAGWHLAIPPDIIALPLQPLDNRLYARQITPRIGEKDVRQAPSALGEPSAARAGRNGNLA